MSSASSPILVLAFFLVPLAALAQEIPSLEFENIRCKVAGESWYRAKVPNGWLVKQLDITSGTKQISITFVPDPDHTWGKDSEELTREESPGADEEPRRLKHSKLFDTPPDHDAVDLPGIPTVRVPPGSRGKLEAGSSTHISAERVLTEGTHSLFILLDKNKDRNLSNEEFSFNELKLPTGMRVPNPEGDDFVKGMDEDRFRSFVVKLGLYRIAEAIHGQGSNK